MSDRPIQVGDLVFQFTACCAREFDRSPYVGVPHTLTRIAPRVASCRFCGFEASGLAGYVGRPGIYLPWLKRIPPLSELEGQRTQEDMKEPA